MIKFIFILSFLCGAEISASNIKEEEYMMDDISGYVDPSDMLAFSTPIKSGSRTNALKEGTLNLEDGCSLHKETISSLTRKLDECITKLAGTKATLKQTVDVVNTIQNKRGQNESPAVTSFYRRLLKSFWNMLEMEQLEKMLANEEKRIEMLHVSISLENINTFKNFFNVGLTHSEIDQFFYSNFKKAPPKDDIPFTVYLQREWLQPMANLQLWLCGLGVLVLVLSCWAFSLCVIDIQRNMRWTRVVGVIFFLLFVISCVEQWRIMVKNVEAKKRNDETQVGPNDCAVPQSYWESIRIAAFGGESKCETYHRQVLLEASEEVTPLMAITETVTRFFLEPLLLLGTYFGRFFNNFYTNVPFIWAIPATAFFCLILTAVLFASFGYSIEFPFWMGGIRPVARSNRDEKQLNHMLEENRKQLREERNSLLNEAKNMLSDISIAAIGHTQRMYNETATLQPFFANSASVIERQLEHIVSKRFNFQLERRASEPHPADEVDYAIPTALVPAHCESYPQEDFVSQIKTILEDSSHSDVSYASPQRASDSSDGDIRYGFLAEVREVMTP